MLSAKRFLLHRLELTTETPAACGEWEDILTQESQSM
jgi:hypothetical protein